ncbi:MAG: glycosyltransferase family 10 [Chlamydiae bacterium]|nr:glycosyltransferase family 10 [Chlamydiota bacterium]
MTEKVEKSSIKNIDFICLMNFDQRQEQLVKSLEQLNPYKICPHGFSAVNSTGLSLEMINNIGVTFMQGMNKGKEVVWFSSDEPGGDSIARSQLLTNPNLSQAYRIPNLELASEKFEFMLPRQSSKKTTDLEESSDRSDINNESRSHDVQTIDILVQYDFQGTYTGNWNAARSQGYNVRVFRLGYENTLAKIKEYLTKDYSENTKKVIFMEDFIPRDLLAIIPISKRVLFLWEPIGKIEDNNYFSVVYTFNDNLVGTNNYRKFCYPFLMSMCSDPLPFKQKKLCTAVISHWLPERIHLIEFFKNHCYDTFDLFGYSGGPFTNHFIYKGPIAGYHSESYKLNTLKKYKFLIAFENSACPHYNITSGYCAPGYISEKIFAAFASGCVPIYYGAPNIETYIPKNCFVNYLDFRTPEELYDYIVNMTEDVYELYLQNIQKYLCSDSAKKFSQTAFEATILEAAVKK